MIKVALSGCNGSMGQVVVRTAERYDNIKIVAGYDIDTTQRNNFRVYNDLDQCKEDIDVIIDFSHPSALERLLAFALKRKIPVVIATTGLPREQKLSLEAASMQIPVFFSANMSLGINLLVDLVKQAAAVLSDTFDIEIIEKHHNRKIDAPSGTALLIADAINEVLSNKFQYVYDRHASRKRRSKNEIGIHAVRGGTIAGEHTVIFAGNDEIIEINHSARSRDIFAEGALKAAAFIYGKSPGLYNMNDMIKGI